MNSENLKLSENRNYLGCNMEWTKEQIISFQMHNKIDLAKINATLQPDKNLSGKVGIFAPGQNGDLITAMSVLKYREQIFGNKGIIWFANAPNAEALCYSPISEVRPWPWANNGLPENSPDFYPLLCDENNRLNKSLAKDYKLTADLDEGFFPMAWMLLPQKRHGIDYPNCSRKVFGIQDDYPWHPVLSFSDDEKIMAATFMERLPPTKTIMWETFAGSDQSKLSDEMVKKGISICKEKWPWCNIIFVSHKYLKAQEKFPDNFFEQDGIYSGADFTVRQCALLNHFCKLLISVSSGISVACSAWGMNIPIIQYTGSFICSTKSLSNGRFELVTADNKTKEVAEKEFEEKLIELLNEYK